MSDFLIFFFFFLCWLLEKLTIARPTHLSRALALDLFKAHLVFFRNAAKALRTICHMGFSSNFLAAAADVFIGYFGQYVFEGSTSHFVQLAVFRKSQTYLGTCDKRPEKF